MELDETTMGVIGILAGILILSGWVPQIVRGYKTKRLNDVSPYLMILIFAGAVLWLIYGILIVSYSIIIANIAIVASTISNTCGRWLTWHHVWTDAAIAAAIKVTPVIIPSDSQCSIVSVWMANFPC